VSFVLPEFFPQQPLDWKKIKADNEMREKLDCGNQV
jgi:hypothetical protein